MISIYNFINPNEELINRISIFHITSYILNKYIISDSPQKSADLLFISTDFIHKIFNYREFQYIPYVVYGQEDFLEKSFALGASDFLKYPWTFTELEIRASRLINKDKLIFKWGKIQFSNECIKTEKNSLPFSVCEYKILSILASNMDKTISRENIHYKLGINNKDSRVVDVYINSIRNKINQLQKYSNSHKIVIRTIRGKGYTINSQFDCG